MRGLRFKDWCLIVFVCLILWFAATSCRVYPPTVGGHVSRYGAANVPTKIKENRHF